METERPLTPLLLDQGPEVVGDRGSRWAPRQPAAARPPVGAGLENLGNTCFLNAVLQCITHTVPLLQSLRTTPHPCPCSSDGGNSIGDSGRFCSLSALRQHVDLCICERERVVKPCGFVNNLSNISSSFSRYQQEDAHEFLSCLLDNLHSGCLGPHSNDNSSPQKDSFINKIFGGRLRSQVQCCNCGHCSDTYEPLLDISLEIEDAECLEDALESFTKVEKIEDPEIKFTCEGCKAHVSVQKQLTLDQAPLVVALHLKRFKSNGYVADKIDKFVKYPMNLDLKPFHSNPKVEEDLKYELYAAVMHQGISSLYGHYYCFVRPSADSWYIMDDEKVYPVNEENALAQSAYILFYMKQGTPWFSSLLEGGKMVKYVSCGNMTSPVSVVDHVESYQNTSSESEDNCNDFVETKRRDETLNSCNDAHSDTDNNATERDNASYPLGASMCVVSKIEGNQAHCAASGLTKVSSQRLNDACLDSDANEVSVSDVSCLPSASQCGVPEIERNQAEDPASCCIAPPCCRPSSSDCDVNGAEKDHCTSPLGVDKCITPQNEGNLATGAVNGGKKIAPFTPKQLSMDKFYDETWEEDEKENSPKQLFNSEPGKSAGKVNSRELAVLSSYLRSMPRSRRVGLEQFMHPGCRPSSAEHQKRKRKLHLDGEHSPCFSSRVRQASSNLLPSSVLQELVAQDDSQLILAINSNQGRKRK